MSRPFLFLAAAALMLQGACAQSDHRYPLTERSVTVAHHDLNLADPRDARIMLSRIHQAARDACGLLPERDRVFRIAPRFVTHDYTGCVALAEEKAIAKLHAPVVSRLFAESRAPSPRQAAAY